MVEERDPCKVDLWATPLHLNLKYRVDHCPARERAVIRARWEGARPSKLHHPQALEEAHRLRRGSRPDYGGGHRAQHRAECLRTLCPRARQAAVHHTRTNEATATAALAVLVADSRPIRMRLKLEDTGEAHHSARPRADVWVYQADRACAEGLVHIRSMAQRSLFWVSLGRQAWFW